MQSKRIVWVDQAKAFLIFCVVYGHVGIFTMNGYQGLFSRILDVFCMPMFFFLSGMFLKSQLGISYYFANILRKIKQLIIPFVFCGISFTILCCTDMPWWSLFWYPGGESHNGYWFLLVLFELHLLFIIIQLIVKALHIKNLGGIFAFYAVVCISLLLISYLKLIPEEPWATILSFHRIHYNFPFFILGYYFKNNIDNISLIITTPRTYTIATTIFLLLFFIRDRFEIRGWPIDYIIIVCALVSIIYILNKYGSKLPFASTINYVGQHTLDIYVLHYFFIPKNLMALKPLVFSDYMKDYNILVDFVLSSSIAIIVVGVSLVVSKLLSQNKIFNMAFLGKF